MKIYLSPSNQTNNLYGDGKHTEQEVCYLIAQKTQDYLTAFGVDTKLGKPLATMSQRVKESNEWKSDYHICIHTNAGGGKGCEVYCFKGNENNKYVKKVYENLSFITPTSDRGIKDGSNLYEVKYTSAKCIYCECAFHDVESEWILSHIDDIAHAIALSFCESHEDINNLLSEPVLSPTHYWRVQLGAFTSEERAKAFAKEIREKYNLDTYIVH